MMDVIDTEYINITAKVKGGMIFGEEPSQGLFKLMGNYLMWH